MDVYLIEFARQSHCILSIIFEIWIISYCTELSYHFQNLNVYIYKYDQGLKYPTI